MVLGSMDSELINRKLYASGSSKDYNGNITYQAHLLDQYKTYLTSAENISNRRQTANAR